MDVMTSRLNNFFCSDFSVDIWFNYFVYVERFEWEIFLIFDQGSDFSFNNFFCNILHF